MTGPGRGDASSPKSSRPNWTDLGPRTASAAVLIAVTATALWLGGYVFAAVVGAVFAGAYREWETMVTLAPLTPLGMALVGLLALAALAFPWLGAAATLGLALVGAVAALVAGGEAAPWRAFGLMFFGLVIVATLSLRGGGLDGVLAGVYLGTVVWSTDTAAFFTGRQVGGERLAPDISPGKTWSGAIGGLGAGTVFGTLLWLLFTDSPWWIGLVLSAALSLLGQVGDLSESALKRRFRVKDSGDIIPGHGGLMDRLDSLVFGVLFLAALGVVHAGGGAIAAGALHW